MVDVVSVDDPPLVWVSVFKPNAVGAEDFSIVLSRDAKERRGVAM